MKKLFLVALVALFAIGLFAQNIDFNRVKILAKEIREIEIALQDGEWKGLKLEPEQRADFQVKFSLLYNELTSEFSEVAIVEIPTSVDNSEVIGLINYSIYEVERSSWYKIHRSRQEKVLVALRDAVLLLQGQ